MGDLSPHFSRSEFTEHDNGALPAGMPAPSLIAALERLRSEIGRPIPIVSGYRSPAYNAEVGGARDSRHTHGDAADISSALHVTVDQARRAGFTGIGFNRAAWVVHVDTRPGPRVQFLDV
jgi:uncharacterized protein YcbK (DUF882 family)